MAVTGSWHKEGAVRFWDVRTQQACVSQVALPHRVRALDAAGVVLAVATAERGAAVFDLRQPQQPFSQGNTPLRWSSTAVAVCRGGQSYALGSAEARCAVRYVVEADNQRMGCEWRAHRFQKRVYAVNDISVNAQTGGLATAGADGSVSFWSPAGEGQTKAPEHKKTLRLNGPVPCLAYNPQGTMLAYAVSYDWSQGFTGLQGSTVGHRILIHQIQSGAAKGPAWQQQKQQQQQQMQGGNGGGKKKRGGKGRRR